MKSILVLAGPSGVGKTSVAVEILSKSEKYKLIRSATTRRPRGDGHDGEYIYFSEEEFENLITSGELLEYMNYSGNFYGTPYSEINLAFSEGKIPLLILDLAGVNSLRRKNFDFSVFVFYIFEDPNVIEKRLYDRELLKNPSVSALETFLKRRAANLKDYSRLPAIADNFDAFVKNETVEKSADAVIKLHKEFSLGRAKNIEENTKIAEELSLFAKERLSHLGINE